MRHNTAKPVEVDASECVFCVVGQGLTHSRAEFGEIVSVVFRSRLFASLQFMVDVDSGALSRMIRASPSCHLILRRTRGTIKQLQRKEFFFSTAPPTVPQISPKSCVKECGTI